MLFKARTRISAERGSLLIEVMVAAVLVAIMGAALFGALDSSAKVSGISKARAGAAAVAQDDQERMRAMPVVALNNMRQHRDPVVMGKQSYVVDSRADWIADAKGATDCTANGKAADYLKITTTVSAKGILGLKPVVVTSTVTPAPGTFQGNEGSAAVTVVDRNGIGIPGLTVTINGPTFASDVTDSNGCAFFGYEPEGDYTGLVMASNYVDVDGNVSGTLPNTSFGVSISAGTVATVQPPKIDVPGKVRVHFKTTPAGAPSAQDSKQGYAGFADNGVKVNSGTRVFGNGTPTAAMDTTATLFPFTDSYSVFAGDCTNNDPAKNGATATNLSVLPGKQDYDIDVPVPPLNVLAQMDGTPKVGLTVLIKSTTSGCSTRTWQPDTVAGGLLADPGLPYGSYSVCVDNRNLGGTTRHTSTVITPAATPNPIALTGTSSATTYVFNLKTTGTASPTAKCT